MADNLSQRKRDLEEIKQLSLEILKVENDSAVSDEKRLAKLDTLIKKRKTLGNQIKEGNKIVQDRLNYLSDEEKSISSISGAYKTFQDSQKQSLSIAESFVGNDEEKQKIITKTLELSRSLSEVSPEQTKEYLAASNALKDQVEQNKVLLAGNDELIQSLEAQAAEAENISMATKFQKKQMEQTYEATQKLNEVFQSIGGVFRTLVSSAGGFVGTLAIGGAAAGKKLLDTSYQLGGSLLDTSNIATTLFGTVFEDAVGTTKNLSKEFGGLSDVSLKTQFRTNVIAKNLGIGAGEAASLTGQFARLNDGSAETAQNLIQSTKNLAQQNGLVPADVMADVANSAEAFALFGKEGGTNIAEAAIAAGKLGVSMSQISGIADNLLDFESSINAELQLGAMLGKNINLDKARALAYEGDLGGMVRETLSSLGGIDEFNKMDVFAKREVANLLGVSADEFQKMAANADKLGKNGEIIPTQYEAALNNMKAFGGQLLTGVQTLGSMAVAAGQMGFSLKDGLSSMKGMGGLGGKIGKIFGGGAKAAGPLTKAGAPDMRFNSNKGLGKMSKGGGMGGMMKGMGAGMKGMASGFAAFANPATLLGLAAITAGIIGIGYALKVAAPGIESLGKAIGSIVESIGNAVKTIIGGLGDFFMKVSSVATPELALSVLGLAGGFYALTGSLAAFAIAGIAAIPAMLAVSAFGATSGLLDLGGDGGSSGDSDLINEIKGLRDDLISGKVGVYLDGKKVTAAVARVSNASSFNVYSN